MTTQEQLITAWIAATNSFDVEAYLAFYTDDAALDDPGVGERFEGKAGIASYYDSYFIGYRTSTRLVALTAEQDQVHVEVHFTGDFPGGETGGTFDVTLRDDKIAFVRADLS